MVNTGMTGKAIVMGFSGKPLELLEVEKVRQDEIPVLRRYTGGGTVIVDHMTFFASIVHNVSFFHFFYCYQHAVIFR